MAAVAPPESWKDVFRWLAGTERFDEAQAVLRAAWRFADDGSDAATGWYARACFEARDYEEAARAATLIANKAPSADSWFNAGIAALLARRFVESEAALERAAALRPSWRAPRLNCALAIEGQGRIAEAARRLEAELAAAPPDSTDADFARFKLAWHRARAGDWRSAFEFQRRGRRLSVWGAYAWTWTIPRLERADEAIGRRVIVVGEGGFGDEIAHVRFGSALRAMGVRADYLPCHRSLIPILEPETRYDRTLSGPGEVREREYDFWCAAHDLPAALDLNEDKLKAVGLGPGFVRESLRESVAPIGDAPASASEGARLRVGLRWRGAERQDREQGRALPLSELKALVARSRSLGAEFVSLQNDALEAERLLDARFPLSESSTWRETVEAISDLHLVVTSCTAVAHLSCAMGKPTLVMAPHAPSLYWAQAGDRSPWYESARIFRQDGDGSWARAFQSAGDEIARRLQ